MIQILESDHGEKKKFCLCTNSEDEDLKLILLSFVTSLFTLATNGVIKMALLVSKDALHYHNHWY